MILNRRWSVAVITLFAAATGAVWLSAQSTASPAAIRGFSAASAAAQAAREREMKASPSAKLAEADFDVMTAEPHHTGSPYEIKLADYVADQFKKFGLKPGGDNGGWLQRYSLPQDSAATAPNTVGILEGSDPKLKNEYVAP